MEFDPHQRARFLVGEALSSGISPRDALWLRNHLADCDACALYQEEMEGVMRGLTSFAFDVDPALGDRVHSTVATRVQKATVARWWALAAAALLVVAVIPLYNGVRDAEREGADALLIERVENRVWRAVPVAMQPLVQPQPEETK